MGGEVTTPVVDRDPEWDEHQRPREVEQPEEAVWVPDARYVAAWREARDATDALTDALAAVDGGCVSRGDVVLTPSTDGVGRPVVRFAGRASPEAVRRVADVLRRGAGARPGWSAGR
ncbi:hypothetical protein GCM10022420_055910 [Streptomyces iranensis]